MCTIMQGICFVLNNLEAQYIPKIHSGGITKINNYPYAWIVVILAGRFPMLNSVLLII